MSSGSPESDFHVQDPPSSVPGSLAYVLRQERCDSPLDESQIVERERIRRILRHTENSQNVSQSNLSYLEDISRTQDSVPSPADKTSSDEQSKVEDQSKQAGDSTETLSFPEDEKAEELHQESQENTKQNPDILNEVLQGLYIQSDESREEVIGIPEVTFVTISDIGVIESKEDEMDIDEVIVYGDPLGSMRDAVDIQDPEEPSGGSVELEKGTIPEESPSTLETDTVDELFEEGSDQQMLDLSDTSQAPEELSGGSENDLHELPEHSQQGIVQEHLSPPEKDTVDELFEKGSDEQMLDLSDTSQAPEDPSGSSEYRLSEHLEQEIVQKHFLLPEKDTVDELFEERSDEQMLDLPDTSQAPEEPSGATGKELHDLPEHSCQGLVQEHFLLPEKDTVDELFEERSDEQMLDLPDTSQAPEEPSGAIGKELHDLPEQSRQGQVQEHLSPPERDTVDEQFEKESNEQRNDSVGISSPPEEPSASMGDILDEMAGNSEAPRATNSSSGAIPKTPRPGGSSERASGKTWMNMADFMKMYKKKQGNAPQKNYTSQEELLKDLKKLAKCLKIREGSKLKPEKFFRGLLPEYPAEPGYLEKKYGSALKTSKGGSGKLPEERLHAWNMQGSKEVLAEPVESIRNAPNASVGEILEELIERDEDSRAEGPVASEKDTVDRLFNEDSEMQTGDTPGTPGNVQSSKGLPEESVESVQSIRKIRNAPNASMGEISAEVIERDEDSRTEDPAASEEDTVDRLFNEDSEMQTGDTPGNVQSSKGLPEESVESVQSIWKIRNAPNASVGEISEELIDREEHSRTEDPADSEEDTVDRLFNEDSEMQTGDTPGNVQSSEGLPEEPVEPVGPVRNAPNASMAEISVDSRAEDPADSEEDTVDRLFNEDSEMQTGDTPGNVQNSEELPEESVESVQSIRKIRNALGETSKEFIDNEDLSRARSSFSGTIPKIQSEKVAPRSGGSSERASGKTWMNMGDFMKMYKKKQGNAQKNYTSQEEFLEDLKKLAKCLKIREGSKLKPEKFFRGLLPEYPAEPGYLEKKYGGFLKKSSSKAEGSPTEEPETVSEESQNSSSSFCSDETVIFRPLCILPESEELSDSN
ncbi:uncharacterized protein LOC129800559 isoform X2 [Phlebotomus papatasi]|uniref:uncharacterized protein LOC129800559 isoform X2 n=1 Tax=Phlebotomus papatasi TaxID=29031 RepID=UPI0024838C1F|nr:uncharacterized protein LOC129800559 isoform X2 [Phlebotomus papatasi]